MKLEDIGIGHARAPLDQGSDNVSAMCALIYKVHCDISLAADPSHGVQSDLVGALKESGLLAHVAMMGIAFNIAHASWDWRSFSPRTAGSARVDARPFC